MFTINSLSEKPFDPVLWQDVLGGLYSKPNSGLPYLSMNDAPLYMPPSRGTMMHEIVIFSQVMKTTLRQGWVNFVPDASIPYRTSGRVPHREWLSSEEY